MTIKRNATDEEVLTQVLERVLNDPRHPRHEQVKAKLKTDSRLDVAVFLVAIAQSESLHLYPWQHAPADLDNVDLDPDDGNYKVALLLRRMLRRGISRYHPDPEAALTR